MCFVVFSPHYWTHLASHNAKHLLAAWDSRKVICLHGSAEKQDGVEDIKKKNITNSQFISPRESNYHYRLVQIPMHPYLQHISQTISSERHQLYFLRQLRKIQSKSAPSTRFLCCNCGEGQRYKASEFMQCLFLSETSYAQKILIQCILDILHITSWEFQYAFILILLNE